MSMDKSSLGKYSSMFATRMRKIVSYMWFGVLPCVSAALGLFLLLGQYANTNIRKEP